MRHPTTLMCAVGTAWPPMLLQVGLMALGGQMPRASVLALAKRRRGHLLALPRRHPMPPAPNPICAAPLPTERPQLCPRRVRCRRRLWVAERKVKRRRRRLPLPMMGAPLLTRSP